MTFLSTQSPVMSKHSCLFIFFFFVCDLFIYLFILQENDRCQNWDLGHIELFEQSEQLFILRTYFAIVSSFNDCCVVVDFLMRISRWSLLSVDLVSSLPGTQRQSWVSQMRLSITILQFCITKDHSAGKITVIISVMMINTPNRA